MRKIMVLLMAILLVFAYVKQPVLKGKGAITVYLGSSSSQAQMQKTNAFEFYKYAFCNVQGESKQFFAKEFNYEEYIKSYGAKEQFTEVVDNIRIIYLSFDNARYKKVLNGVVVNMSIALDNELVTVGVPIIFGSF